MLPTTPYEKICIEDIAARAGVHKTTVYRRWGNKRSSSPLLSMPRRRSGSRCRTGGASGRISLRWSAPSPTS
jgi:hypothetical protein